MNLEIRKKGVKNFEHVYNSYKLTFSDLRIAFNGNTQNVLITRENGAFVIKREGFNVTEISVYDDTGAGTEETFVNVNTLANRLIELGYIAFYEDGDIVPSELISTDASNDLSIGTDGLLFVPPAGAATNGLPIGGTTGQILKKQSATDFDADWENESAGAGTVTSVAVIGSDGIEVDSGSPITTNGTIALGINASTLRSHINVEDGAQVNTVNSVNGQTGVVVLKEHEIKGKAQLELTATGSITADFENNSVIVLDQTGNVTLTITAPTLAIGETATRFIVFTPNSNTIALPVSLTDEMVGTVDALDVTYRIVVTYIRKDGSTVINPATLTKL